MNLIYHTNQCKNHKKRSKYKPKYTGHIDKVITQPIRAGILMSVDQDKLIDLISSLLPITKESEHRETVKKYIEEISQYDAIHLANNSFWGHDSSSRVTKERYQHPKKNKK